MSILPALSIRQPWAWLVANGHKDIENREWKSWNPALKFRGEFLIHTGAKFDLDADPQDILKMAEVYKQKHPEKSFPIIPHNTMEYPLGGIVGVAEIVDVVTKSDSPWFMGEGFYGLVIANAKPLPFIPCKGQLGFFNVPYDGEI